MNRLVLIDGNAIMHRAYHALPPLTTPEGKPAHIVYGFVSMILKMCNDLKPSHVAVAFDRPGPTFRTNLYSAYQIQRPKMEDDFVSQIPLVHETIAAFGIPIFELDGFEADDMIGTITNQVQTKSIDEVIIVTGDRDILQLVEDKKVFVYMPTKGLSEGRLYGEKEVVERMGVKPKLVVDLKALAGDPSDNYPGVSGIGPKTAVQLLNTYGSLEKVYKNISHIKGATMQAKLLAGKDSALLGKNLATIRTDAPIRFHPDHAHFTTLNTPKAREALEVLHFPSLIKRLAGGNNEQMEKSKKKKETEKAQDNTDQQPLF